MRRLYGSRSIDASAPQSERDTTPSGRARIDEQRGMTRAEVTEREDRLWQEKFPERPSIVPLAVGPERKTRPFDLVRRGPAKSPLEAIQQANESGLGAGTFFTPYGNVTRTASLMPAESMPDVTDYLNTPARSATSLFSPRQRQRTSILDGANRWLQSL